MSGEELGKGKDDAQEVGKLRAQIQKLQQELEKKNAGVSRASATEKHPSRARGIISNTLLGVGLILLLVTLPVLWLHRTLLTTEGWVTAVGPLAEDPAVQESVADAVALEYSRQVNIEEWVGKQLPEQSSGLVEPLTIVIEMAIQQLARVVVSSDAFANIWTEVNRVSHNLVISGLSRVQDAMDGQLGERLGEVNIDLRALIEQLQEELAKRGFSFTLPEEFTSQVTLLQSTQLTQLVDFVRTLDTVAPWLALFAIVSIAGCIGVSNDRRKTLRNLGIGIVVIGLLLIVADSVNKWRVVEQVSPEAVFSTEATSEAYDTIASGLVSSLRASVLLGIFLWLGAVAMGPSQSMVRMRQGVLNRIHELGKDKTPGRTELWIGQNRNVLQIGVLILASIALIIPSQRTVAYIIVLAVLVVMSEFMIEFFGRASPPPVTHA